MATATEASSSTGTADAQVALTISRDPDDGTLQFVLDGEPLRISSDIARRPAPETRALMAATADLAFFRDMRAELGSSWQKLHADICAQMQPVLCRSGDLLFAGIHRVRPLVVLSGHALLLSLPQPTRGDTEEVAEVGPGDCLAPAVVTWLQPRTATAICEGDVRLLALPAALYGDRLKLPHLRMLQASRPSGRGGRRPRAHASARKRTRAHASAREALPAHAWRTVGVVRAPGGAGLAI